MIGWMETRKIFRVAPKACSVPTTCIWPHSQLFQTVRRYIESLGPVRIEAAKTQVSFGSKTKFAWVWLPQIWTKKRPETSITLTFDVGREIKHDRIAAAVEVRPGRWTHHVVIETDSNLDGHVRKWLKEAYARGAQRVRTENTGFASFAVKSGRLQSKKVAKIKHGVAGRKQLID